MTLSHMRSLTVGDPPLHYVDFGGEGPTVVLVHGLGGSHVNWIAVGPLLARRAHVLALDLPGFGLTRPAVKAVTLEGCRAALHRFLELLAPAPAVLVGNSMGGAVSILEAAAHPGRVAGLVLVDPAVPLVPGTRLERAVLASFLPPLLPRLAILLQRRRRMRLGPEGLVHELLAFVTTDWHRLPASVVEAHVELARQRFWFPWADAAFISATRSLMFALARPWTFYRAMRRVTAPTLLVQGSADRLVKLAAARAAARRCPSWELEVMEGVGHVPQLEAPEKFLAIVLGWLERQRLIPAAAAAR